MSAVTAPLSLYLARFSAPLPPPAISVEIELPLPEPQVVMTAQELDARLEAAADNARRDADQRHSAEIAKLNSAHEAALSEALSAARSEWAAAAGSGFGSQIDTQLSELREMIADRIARVLRPLLMNAVRIRTVQALTDTIDRLLAEPIKPSILVSGPEDLLAAMSEARPVSGIDWVVADEIEVKITAGAAQIETRLAETLAAIEMTESPHVR